MKIANVSCAVGAVHACTSCQICAAVCPVDAIRIELDADGFYRPVVEEGRCIQCAACLQNCYKYDTDLHTDDQYRNAWACRTTDRELLRRTTSGGIAYLLAKQALAENQLVFGVAYDNSTDRAVARLTDTDAEAFIGSKYIQAYTEKALIELLEKAKDHRIVVFGLPCQIYAIDNTARNRGFRDRLILIDLFCHGCPSMLLWDAHVDAVHRHMKEKSFDSVWFRSKEKGWHEFCECFEKDGRKYVPEGDMSPFYQMFFSNQLLNEACSSCGIRSTLAYTDIRLGDFWGAAYDEDKHGVSAAVAVTEKGENFLKKLPAEVFLKSHSLKEICKEQAWGVTYPVRADLRQALLGVLRNGGTMEDVLQTYLCGLPLKKRMIYGAKKIFAHLPQRLRFKIKKIMHSKR